MRVIFFTAIALFISVPLFSQYYLTGEVKDVTEFFQPMNESYSPTIENEFVSATKFPETGYAVNVDRASYSNIRSLSQPPY